MPSFRATASAVLRESPVSMTMRTPDCLSAAIAPSVLSLIGSATAAIPAATPFTAKNTTVFASARQASARSSALRIDASLREKVVAAYKHGFAVDIGLHAEAVDCIECAGNSRRQAARLCPFDDGEPYRMLGKLLHTCDKRERFIFWNALGHEIGQCGMPEGQCAGLVHHYG